MAEFGGDVVGVEPLVSWPSINNPSRPRTTRVDSLRCRMAATRS
jgi:hypothetical protein